MPIGQFPSQGPAPASQQPAQAPRPMITELESTTSFEFPRERGTPEPSPGTLAAAPAAPTVVQAPVAPAPSEKPYAEQNAEFYSVELPSGFQFYDHKHISLRTLQGAHLAKFSRAHKEEKLRYTVEGLSATLEPGRSAFDLSVGDFYFLLYWQRVNSFAKNPMLVTAFCDNVGHNEKVHMGYEGEEEVDDPDNPGSKKLVTAIKKLPEETLMNEVLVNHTTLETKYLDPIDFSKHPIRAQYDLHVETMRDVVETTEWLLDNDATEEDLFHIKYAVFVRRGPGRETIKERMAVVAKMSPDDFIDFDRYIDAVTAYGVAEFAQIKCKECSASMKVKITIDALTFLPGGR